MQTRGFTWQRLATPVVFAMACFLMTLYAWRTFGGSTPLQPHRYEFAVRLPDAGGLVPGADVRTSGVVIGRVVKVDRLQDKVKVIASLETRYAPIRTKARAIARTKSLLGEGYLEIAPGPTSAHTLAEGSTLADAQVARSQQLADVLETFTPRARNDFRAAVSGFSRAIDGRGADLNDTLGWAPVVAEHGTSVITKLDHQRADVRRLLRSSSTVLAALGDQQAAVQATITSSRDIFAATASRQSALRATLKELPPFLGQLTRTARSVSAASGELNRAASSLEPVAPDIAPLLRDVVRYSPAFRDLLSDLPGVMSATRHAAPSIRSIATTAKPALARTYPAFRELAPLLELASANRSEIIAVLGNVASLLNGRMIGPGDRVVSYGTGVPTIWNELLGGWVRKLPTNRANPYLKPGGLRSLASQGLVESYGCKHTGNPLYVPPTGTGAPPCKVQGPWTVQGKSRYYPNLEPAAP